MMKQHHRLVYLLSLTIVVTLGLGLSGCGGPSDRELQVAGKPVVTLVARPTGTKVSPGQQIAIAAEVVSNTEIQFEWTVENGRLSNTDRQSVIYTAPETSGLYNVDVAVTNESGTTSRSVTFEVVGAIAAATTTTATMIPPFTPTKEPLATPTEKPLATPTWETPATTTMELSATPTTESTPTEEPPLSITITGPKKEVECPEDAPCTFMIEGTSTGIASQSEYKIIPFVNPAPGSPDEWFPQFDRPIGSDINEDGSWQAEVQIGDEVVKPGHRFEVAAMVMSSAAQIPVEFQPLPVETGLVSKIVNLVTTASPVCQSIRLPLEDTASFPGEIKIVTPENCTTGFRAETSIPVLGTYEDIPDNVDIWALVYPPNLVYYVQSPAACQGAKMTWNNGKWQVPVYLGERGGDPEWFDIVVVLADQEASQFLSDWVQNGCRTGSYVGITAAQLEQMNIMEKAHITVQTVD